MHLDVQHDIHVARVPDPPEMSTAYSGSPRPREQQALERAGSCYILSPRLLTTASAGGRGRTFHLWPHASSNVVRVCISLLRSSPSSFRSGQDSGSAISVIVRVSA